MQLKPDYVVNFCRPPNTEVKKIAGKWYLYEWSCVPDPVTGRKRKLSGKCLGHISKDGLVPSRSRTPFAGIAPTPLLGRTSDPGVPIFHWRRTRVLRDRLRKHFPDLWEPLYVAALISAAKGLRFSQMQLLYENSFLSVMFPGLSFGVKAESALIRELKKRADAIAAFESERETDLTPAVVGALAVRPAPFDVAGRVFDPASISELRAVKLFICRLSEEAGVTMAGEVKELCDRTGVDPETLRLSLASITAISVNGKWRLAPLGRTAAKTLEKAGIPCNDDVIIAVLRDCEKERKEAAAG